MIGTHLSRYRIAAKLGEGGMGTVYLAEDTGLGRKVALKLLPQDLERDATARRRFLREARTAAAIDHPYSCKIYEVGEADGKAFIAMEYIEGETLAERLEGGSLDRQTAVRYAGEIAEALEKAHEKGIVHRDLKPSNVMITVDDHVKVTDFGLAKPLLPAIEADGQAATLTALTQLGSALGTPPYMSPEQIRGREVDRRSDIFSFGVLLYEMLTGTSPFLRNTLAEIPAAILTEELPRLEGPSRTASLQRILDRAVAKDPDDRYPNLKELLADLRTDASGTLGSASATAARATDISSLQAADHASRARTLMQNFSNPQDLALAQEAWQKVLALRPENPAALAGLATSRALIAWNSSPEPDQLARADQEAQRALEIDPQQASAYLALTIVYQLQGLLDTAVEMSKRSIELAPDDPWALQGRARFLMDLYGDFEAAAKLAQRAVATDPRHFPAWFQLGWAQFELELPDAAERSFREAIALRPDFGAGYMGLGAVLLGSGRYDEARQSLEKAVQIDPHSLMAHYLLGVAHHYLGDPPSALEAFRRMVESNPDHPLASYGLLEQAVEHQALGEPQPQAEALSAAERRFKTIPGLWISLKGLAGVAAVRGETGSALDWLRQARLAGLHSVHQLTLEPSLDSLRGNPGFLALLEEIRQSRGQT